MSLLEILFQFLLEPLTLILETIYGVSFELMLNYGAPIIPLSLAVNFMLLPFYKRADALQAEERAAQNRMKTGIKHIKSAFKGDERYMMLQTFYRQNHYKPIYSLRSILPLALEIPFFIAAYRFLSSITGFDGKSFGPFLHNLGAPDQLLTIGGISINILPILMTVINVISTEIYTIGAPFKEKLTLHSMALLFLILLYDSPSALVFYWTLNNIFSLFKNLISKSPNPIFFRNLTCSLLGVVSILYATLFIEQQPLTTVTFGGIGLLLQIPSLTTIITLKRDKSKSKNTNFRGDNFLFFTSCVCLSLLMGLLIPTATIVSSPAEFMLFSDPSSPLIYVFSAFLSAAGFMLWMGLFYYLANPFTRGIFTISFIAFSGVCIVNYLFFGTNLGTLLPMLQYEKTPDFTSNETVLNFEIVLLIATLLIVLWMKKRNILKNLLLAACIAVIGISAYNAFRIQMAIPEIIKTMESENDTHYFTLSTKGKNIILVMLDRAINGYLPYLFQEKPELKQKFNGFIWYPNTISYSNNTNTGSPAIYGGYDYRPAQINKRSDISLKDKHNEALKVMPVIFSDAGFDVTVCDPPYAGYQQIPELAIFDDYPGIKKFNTESGMFRDSTKSDIEKRDNWKRNFFYFAVMKSSPLILQPLLYQGGLYYNGKYLGRHSPYVQTRDGISKATGQRDNFLDAYSAISAYSSITEISDSDKNTFTMLYNSTAHNITLLKEPEYEPYMEIDNTEFDKNHQDRFTIDGRTVRVADELEMMSYQCNMAAMLKLGEWFDDLRQKGVYENSRIIIVADHGASAMGSFSDMIFGKNPYEDVMGFNPLLMVKDFNSTGFKTDNSFMTNADTPTIAFNGVIDNPVNPFTGNPINSDAKHVPVHHIFHTYEWSISTNNKNVFKPGVWIELSSDNIFDMSSWKTTDKYEGD